MSDDRWQDVRSLFLRSLDVAPDRHQEWLTEQCGGDDELRAAVERLLESDAAESAQRTYLDTDPVDRTADGPESIGPFSIVEVLGEGGMGTVYLAEQHEPMQRRVAIKVVKLGMDTRQVLARFELERQALGLMNHDNIARVFDAGTTERGQPYFVMEYMSGTPITKYCEEHRLTTTERLRLFVQVCAGVQHAHQKGVMHRDLKPGNVLVSGAGEQGVPKIIDFGLARATDQRVLAHSLLTEQGILIGTPEYMSPEQADASCADVDTRTDVYSLGVILYELLTGALPFPSADLRAAGFSEVRRILYDTTAPRPSDAVATADDPESVAAARRTTRHGLVRTIRGDLDWVVLKAMDRDTDRRYDGVKTLADDVERFLGHEPVLAGPPSTAYRLKKLLRRYRAQVLATSAVLLTLIAGVVASLSFALESAENARVAVRRNDEFDMLANVVRLDAAKADEKALYPAWPTQIAKLERWLADHGAPLLAAMPELRRTVDDIDARHATPAEGDAQRIEADRFLQRTLGTLITAIEEFERTEHAGVVERLEWARRVADLTIDRHAAAWREARDAIRTADDVVAHARYAEQPIELDPQMGLAPIGMNPVTRLWEFYHLRSAWDPSGDADAAEIPIPTHRSDGSIVVGAGTGMVFVLIPGGTFTIGAQAANASEVNFDPETNASESPTHTVTLRPFFLARHELTQGQWMRLAGGDNPSQYRPGYQPGGMPDPVDARHPVEQVDWNTAHARMDDLGLTLPTEAQWEYACRAGTTTPWWTGRERATLVTDAPKINIADLAAQRVGAQWTAIGHWPGVDDGFAVHAPVDGCPANAFGLHFVHGNLWEWCRDWFEEYSQSPRAGDGLRTVNDSEATSRVVRSGSYSSTVTEARSASRAGAPETARSSYLGIRPSRAIDARRTGR